MVFDISSGSKIEKLHRPRHYESVIMASNMDLVRGPYDILPPKTCPIEVHVIYVPNFYLTKPDSSIKNWFILKKHPLRRKKCAEIILFGCLFLFEF